ncbi:MAG: tetratricopeptide repeat protein [Deltaproteobacteria bacterium]|nr:tetratricopeptide repeat protein [Deltaproteobacteria bacterium]
MGDLLRFELGPRRGLRRGTSATSWYAEGRAHEATDPARAIGAYERAIAGRPDFADAYNNLGRVLHELHDRGEAAAPLALAETHYRIALCLDPDVALYWFNLGVSVEDQGRTAEAIAAYERALALDPHLADAHFNLARLLELVGRSSADELVLRRAVRHLVRYRDLARVG